MNKEESVCQVMSCQEFNIITSSGKYISEKCTRDKKQDKRVELCHTTNERERDTPAGLGSSIPESSDLCRYYKDHWHWLTSSHFSVYIQDRKYHVWILEGAIQESETIQLSGVFCLKRG